MTRFVGTRWGWVDGAALMMIFMLFALTMTPASWYMKPESYSISASGLVKFKRTVSFGEVAATWTTEIRGGGMECYASGGLTPYQTGPNGEKHLEVTYRLNTALLPCLAPEYSMVQIHQVQILGPLWSRPGKTEWKCSNLPGREVCTKLE